jgi:hypothetical protein
MGMQTTIDCENVHINVDGHEPITSYGTPVDTVLLDQIIGFRNGKPPLSTRTSVRKVYELNHHHLVTCRIVAAEFSDRSP